MRPDEASLLVSCLATSTQRRRSSGAAAPSRKHALAAHEAVGELAAGLACLRGRWRPMSVMGAAAGAEVAVAGCGRRRAGERAAGERGGWAAGGRQTIACQSCRLAHFSK